DYTIKPRTLTLQPLTLALSQREREAGGRGNRLSLWSSHSTISHLTCGKKGHMSVAPQPVNAPPWRKYYVTEARSNVLSFGQAGHAGAGRGFGLRRGSTEKWPAGCAAGRRPGPAFADVWAVRAYAHLAVCGG